jgi:kinesin family protein 5
MEEICDLLRPEKTNLQIRESPTKGIYVESLSAEYVGCEENIYELLALGDLNRRVSATKMNATSSRSHSCFIINITQKDSEGAVIASRVNLVDLAGSERVGKTGS